MITGNSVTGTFNAGGGIYNQGGLTLTDVARSAATSPHANLGGGVTIPRAGWPLSGCAITSSVNAPYGGGGLLSDDSGGPLGSMRCQRQLGS